MTARDKRSVASGHSADHLREVATHGGQVADVVVGEQLTGIQVEMQLAGHSVTGPDQSLVAAVGTRLEHKLGNGVVGDLEVGHPTARSVHEVGRGHIHAVMVLDAGHEIEAIAETEQLRPEIIVHAQVGKHAEAEDHNHYLLELAAVLVHVVVAVVLLQIPLGHKLRVQQVFASVEKTTR